MTFTLGCDPEFFLFDLQRQLFVSAHDLVPGDKKHPYPLDKGAVQVDGTAVEFNIDPANSSKEFKDNIFTVLKQIREMIPRRYEFKFIPSIHYDFNYWNTIPSRNKELGCDPDYDLFGKLRPPPEPKGTLRTAGGHFHIGWTNVKDPLERSHMMDCIEINRLITAGVQRAWDRDTERSKLYSDVGIFRPKKYGIELRGFNNSWVRFPRLYSYLFYYIQNRFRSINDYPEYQIPYRAYPTDYLKEIVL